MTSAGPATDPYGYLEDGTDPATLAWTAAANAHTRATLDALPERAALERRFDRIMDIGTLGVPELRGERTFYTARFGTAEQASLYVREAGRTRALLDPASLDGRGLVTIDWWYASPEGRYVAYGLSTGGDERSTLHVLDVATGARLGDEIPDTRYSSVAWFADESGFWYTRYPPGGDYDVRAFRHVLGTPWRDDPNVFGDGRKSAETLSLAASADGRRLVATVHDGWSRADVYVADTTREPLRFDTLVEGVDALFDVVPGNDRLYVRTDDGASRFRAYEVDPDALPREHWREIVPEGEAVLEAIALTAGGLALHYFENVRSSVRVRRSSGAVEALDGLDHASVLGWSAREDFATLYVSTASYFEPPVIRAVHVAPAEPLAMTVWERIEAPIDASRYRVEQRWFASEDGTRVPMDVLARADLPFDGTAPAVLYGYGGFNVPLVPTFMPSVVPWLDAGGVYAIANLRGGGEFGEAWHRAGMRERKQNVFDDFSAAAEYLGTSGIAAAGRIAAYGGSNGGLLVAALATQRPELVRAIVCAVPLTDMLRYHHFAIARLWIPEYGDPDVPGDAAYLRAYSPYHNVRDGVPYPALFIVSAESDSRVDPMHARKFAARVAAASASGAPVLCSIERDAGHGVGKPRHKVVADLADRWAFLAWQLELRLG